jgi:hypothetical protein
MADGSPAVDLDFFLARLAANADAIAALTLGISEAQAHWKPTLGEWSIVEVVNHLADEEREDFRTRLDFTLNRPDVDWPPIDPEGWVVERAYSARTLAESRDRFLAERRASLAWLEDQASAAWGSAHQHPVLGSFTAADVLGAWLAHDSLHIRQLNELQWRLLAERVSRQATDYAGGW